MAEEVEVHPAAKCFRLMHPDELQELVEDIRANGLRDPITIGRVGDGATTWLVDGRNRLKACQLAGITATYETVEFANDDAVRAFVRSKGTRRNLSKGEYVAGIALMYPDAPMGRGAEDEGRKSAEIADISYRRLAHARQVGRADTSLLEKVRDGVVKLDDALAQIKKDKERAEDIKAKKSRLADQDPDLGRRVAEDRITIDDAIAELEERDKKNKMLIEHGRKAADDLKNFGAHVAVIAGAFRLGAKVLTRDEFETIKADFQHLEELMDGER